MSAAAVLYFAYGSNMSYQRLADRIPVLAVIGRACLSGYRMVCNKHGVDGTGKGNLVPDVTATTWGVLYRLGRDVLPLLDRYEPRYERIAVQVLHAPDEQASVAVTYISKYVIASPRITPAYRAHLLRGAHEHSLPPDYIAMLEQLPVQFATERE